MIVNEGEIRIATAVKAIGFQKLVLFTAPTSVSASTVYTDLTLATFSGYAAATPTWGTIAIDGGGKAAMSATAITFSHSGGGTANTVYGWAWIDDDLTGKKLINATLLASPKSFS